MKISELPKAAAVNDTDVIPLVQSGETKQASRKDFVGVVPNNLKLSDRLLQLTANGEAVGDGIKLPDFGKFELWTDLTLDEDVQAVSISQTDDGRPLKIKELFVYFYGKFNIDASVCLKLYNGVFYLCWTLLKASGDNVDAFWVYCKKVGEGTYFSIYPETQITNGQVKEDGAIQGLNNANKNTKCDISHHATVKTAINFVFGSQNADFKMLAGSHIMAWGVMDDE